MAEETYFLIDFENVGLKGLEGAEKLTAHEHIHLFSTRNAPKITTAILANFNGTNLLVHEVPAKSQSLDMHLVSYLGYLLGSCKPIPKIVILSNDTDYDDIVGYWKNELNVTVKRRDKFQEKEARPAAPDKTKAAAKNADSVRAEPAAKPQSAAEKKAQTKAVETVKDEPAAKPRNAAKKKAQTKSVDADKAEAATAKQPEAVKKTQTKSAEPAEPAAAKTPSPEKKPAETRDKTAVNNAVMKALSAAKFDNEIVGFVASQVTKLFSEKNAKQLIYRSIISKYGQGQGLNIYNHIKKLI